MNKIGLLALIVSVMHLSLVCSDDSSKKPVRPEGFVPSKVVQIGDAVIYLDEKRAQQWADVEANHAETQRRRAQRSQGGKKIEFKRAVLPPTGKITEIEEPVKTIEEAQEAKK